MMLDPGGDDPAPARIGVAAGPVDPLDREVVAFGAAPVKITSDGRAPSAAAMVSRDSSIRRRAARPAVCSEEAFPTVASTAVIASMAAACIGVVAAWSRYTGVAGLMTRPGYPPGGATPLAS